MSRTADIDFFFASPVTVASVLDAIEPAGWVPQEVLGVSYLINADDDYEWQRGEPKDTAKIITELDSDSNAGVTVGISVYSPSADTGGMLLFFAGRTDVSFVPSIKRRPLPGDQLMTDIPWYLHQLVLPLVNVGLAGYETRDKED